MAALPKCEYDFEKSRKLEQEMPFESQLTMEAWKAMYFRRLNDSSHASIVDHHSYNDGRVAYYVHSKRPSGRMEKGWIFRFQAETQCREEWERYEKYLTELPKKYCKKKGNGYEWAFLISGSIMGIIKRMGIRI